MAVTVDDKDDPKEGLAYMVDGDQMRDRFNRAYCARLDAGHKIPVGRGVWVSMFLPEDPNAASSVGGGIALNREALLSMKLAEPADDDLPDTFVKPSMPGDEAPLTIAEAKKRLARSLGVDAEKVKIIIEA